MARRFPTSLALSCFALPILAVTAQADGPVVFQQLFPTPNPPVAHTLSDVAIDGATILVGYWTADDLGPSKGAVYVLERQISGKWVKTSMLVPTTGQVSDFGERVALDGNIAAVGAPSAGQGGGVVWMFERTNGVWAQTAEIHPLGPFGAKKAGIIALSGDDLMIASPQQYNGSKFCGGIYFYHRTGIGWGLAQGPIFPSDYATGGTFALTAAIDGNVAVTSDPNSGRAYVFERSGPGSPWGQAQELMPPNGYSDTFGASVAVSGDWIAIGASTDDQKATDAGSVRMYHRASLGSWIEQPKLLAADGTAADEFGDAVEMHGGRLVVGAYRDTFGNKTDSGSAYVFDRQMNGSWLQTAKLMHPNPATNENVGEYLALAADGGIAVAVPSASDPNLGGVLLFDAQTLSGKVSSISLSSGGSQILDVQAGLANAGRTYLVAGSLSGTSPGMPLPGGFTLPLHYDAYTAFTLFTPNNPVLSNSLGILGVNGGNQATFTLPAGVDPSLAGITVTHAFLVLDSGSHVKLVSNPLAVQLVP